MFCHMKPRWQFQLEVVDGYKYWCKQEPNGDKPLDQPEFLYQHE